MHTVPSAASRDKWLELSEKSGKMLAGRRRKRESGDLAAAESPWDLDPSSLHTLLLLFACWPSKACSPAPASCLVPSPSTHLQDTEYSPSLTTTSSSSSSTTTSTFRILHWWQDNHSHGSLLEEGSYGVHSCQVNEQRQLSQNKRWKHQRGKKIAWKI